MQLHRCTCLACDAEPGCAGLCSRAAAVLRPGAGSPEGGSAKPVAQAVCSCEMTSYLQHEVWYYTVEVAAFVVQLGSLAADALFPRAQGSEVLARLRSNVCVEVHHDTSRALVAYVNIEKDPEIVHCNAVECRSSCYPSRYQDPVP